LGPANDISIALLRLVCLAFTYFGSLWLESRPDPTNYLPFGLRSSFTCLGMLSFRWLDIDSEGDARLFSG